MKKSEKLWLKKNKEGKTLEAQNALPKCTPSVTLSLSFYIYIYIYMYRHTHWLNDWWWMIGSLYELETQSATFSPLCHVWTAGSSKIQDLFAM